MSTRSKIDRWIRNELPKKLINDIENCYIINETDLQCSIYMYLRKYLNKIGADNWRIFNRFYMKKLKGESNVGKYPDIVIFYKRDPKFVFELKWWPKGWRHGGATADRAQLKRIKEKYTSIWRGYFLYVYDKKEEQIKHFKSNRGNWQDNYYYDIPINCRSEIKDRYWVNDWNYFYLGV